jgi:hypothetical protein
VRLELFDVNSNEFRPDATLTISGMLHLVGMVSSGKSTLMGVLAVWAARSGLRVTLVVGDVIGGLRWVEAFRCLDPALVAAPILGSSNRVRHIERLHRVVHGRGNASPFEADPGFDFLSTACALDALRRDEHRTPFAPDKYPCRALSPIQGEDYKDEDEIELQSGPPRGAGSTDTTTLTCPFFGSCQQHRAARDLVTAPIWVANPFSLVYTEAPSELNPERLRYAELVYRHSDLVIVDEADQAQVQLDGMFSPSQTLIGGGDSLLENLFTSVDSELRLKGRSQLGEHTVSRWNNCRNTARAATDRFFSLLRQEEAVRTWIEKDYFTGWTLAEKLAREWSGADIHSLDDNAAYKSVHETLAAFAFHPLGNGANESAHPLVDIALRATLGDDDVQVRDDLRDWITAQDGVHVADGDLHTAVLRLECTVLLCVLADRLDMLIRDWRHVEGPLNLEGNGSLLFHKPPEDFAAVIPDMPMGNVLGFQYLHHEADSEQPAELRLVRCAGVGRWLLVHLHELFAADGMSGPNVLLLSGTSWAGTSPSYHVQVPVGGILHAPPAEVAAIAESSFAFTPFFDATGRMVTCSGRNTAGRQAALREILAQLSRRGQLAGGPSKLEQVRDALPEGRRRILLLVGNYDDSVFVKTELLRLRPDWHGHVHRLIADDETYESGIDQDPDTIRRADVATFAQTTDAWILIAPLGAIERGHNILNDDDEAAFGAAYFLVRPHPRPDDIGFVIHSLAHWALDQFQPSQPNRLEDEPPTGTSSSAHHRDWVGVPRLGEQALRFRNQAWALWRRLLGMQLRYATVKDIDRTAIIWTQLVGVWQVIGRLVRGGCAARVYFCDAAFAPRTAEGKGFADTKETSLLVGMRSVLDPYFTVPAVGEKADVDPADRALVQVLYQPFYAALTRIEGVATDATSV